FVSQPDEYEHDESSKPNKLDGSDESDEKLQIISEFMDADARIPELSITLQEHPDIVYLSKYINTHNITQRYKDQLSIY
ncbi:3764_t:CDS:1, partial [Racocetra persica]